MKTGYITPLAWSGAIYDLEIVFYYCAKELTIWFCGNFSYSNWDIIPNGVFPYVMIIGSLLFFDANFHQKHFQYLQRIAIPMLLFDNGKKKQ
jgi:hypothetical protein